jgi:hypothetical protein
MAMLHALRLRRRFTPVERFLRRLRLRDPVDDESRVGEGVRSCRQRPFPEPLNHLDVGLACPPSVVIAQTAARRS